MYQRNDGHISSMLNQNSQPTVFVSYSHEDKQWLDAMLPHLKPLVRNDSIDVWHDGRIDPGQQWKQEIETMLSGAEFAILLVSANFLESDFIADVELPALLKSEKENGLQVLPVVITPCLYEESPLQPFQSVNNPLNPMEGMKPVEQNQTWVKLARIIKKSLQKPMSGREQGVSLVSPTSSDFTSEVDVETTTVDLELTIDGDLENFSDSEKAEILDAISKLAGVSNLKVKRLREGSIKLTVELPPHLAERVMWAIKSGELEGLAVLDAEIIEETTRVLEVREPYEETNIVPNPAWWIWENMEFVRIEPGAFMMGSENGFANERPAHKVEITKPFYLGTYPVTQEQWLAVMGSNPSRFKGERRPVVNVSWNDVQSFLNKLNGGEHEYRLPTEAEWEYACRAGTTTEYSFGDDKSLLGDYAWSWENSEGTAHPVGQKKPNPWGLYDMHGNVWEWVQDWYSADYYKQFQNKTAIDPKGPDKGSPRVIRGGGWDSRATGLRSAVRISSAPGNAYNYVLGFRLLRTIP